MTRNQIFRMFEKIQSTGNYLIMQHDGKNLISQKMSRNYSLILGIMKHWVLWHWVLCQIGYYGTGYFGIGYSKFGYYILTPCRIFRNQTLVSQNYQEFSDISVGKLKLASENSEPTKNSE